MKKLLLLALSCAALYSPIGAQESPEQKEPTLHEQIAKNYLPSVSDALPEEEVGTTFWQSVKQAFKVAETIKHRMAISERKRCEIALHLLGQHYNRTSRADDPQMLSRQAWRDLELFSNEHATDNTFLSKIDRTSTILGRMKLAETLALPTTDTDLLCKRQEAILLLLNNQSLYNNLRKELSKIATVENNFLSSWRNQQVGKLNEVKKNVPTKFFDQFSHSPLLNEFFIRFMQFNTFCYSAGLSGVGGLMIFVSKFSNRSGGPATFAQTPFLSVIGLCYICMGAMHFALLKADIDMRVILQESLISISQGIASMHHIAAIINSSPHLRDRRLGINERFRSFFQQAPAKSSELSQFLSLLDTNTFKGKASYASWVGKIGVANKLLAEIKDLFIDALVAVAELDVLVSTATLMQETSEESITFSPAKYLTGKTPTVRLQSFWHPMIDRAEVVPNSLVLGEHGASNNSILTGPNAGGKSTVLKAVTLNVLMAQTLGICPSIETSLTPFTSINTYLNITDDIAGGNSLFKSEVLRAQELVSGIEDLEEDAFSFTILDEMFCGTSPLEGAAASYSVAKYLSSFPNSILICATHFPMLTNLEEDTDYLFKNYKVGVIRNEDGTITYPYKLLTGKANQHVAIDILRLEGFSSKILNDAYAIVNAKEASGVVGT